LLMQFGAIPRIWNSATVIPIFKKGVSSDPGNYRPISLTCVASKLFESGIKDALVKHLDSYGILNKSQHGFRAQRSTCSNLLETLADWTLNAERKDGTLVVYVDFKKAFDTVSIPKLLHKLKYVGIEGNLLACVESFLSNRTQKVRVGNALSDEGELVSGVPQGSVLGPVLFNIYINDIVSDLSTASTTKLYADDLKSYVTIHETLDFDIFRDMLSSIENWSSAWQLTIAVKKCFWMFIPGRLHLPVDFAKFAIVNTPIEEVQITSDLGISFTNSLNFHQHIVITCNKARSLIFLIRKRFVSNYTPHLLLAFRSFILPILNYCSPIWSPSNMGDVLLIEKIQKSFTKRLRGLEGLSYKDRLYKCGLRSLELIRLHNDLTLCYKLLHGLTLIDYSSLFSCRDHCGPRSHGLLLQPFNPRTNTGLHSFGYRVAVAWNALSPNVVFAPSLAVFKTHLKYEDLSKFTLLDVDTY
jgi:hypothetical protein